jgi:hypothetical protein
MARLRQGRLNAQETTPCSMRIWPPLQGTRSARTDVRCDGRVDQECGPAFSRSGVKAHRHWGARTRQVARTPPAAHSQQAASRHAATSPPHPQYTGPLLWVGRGNLVNYVLQVMTVRPLQMRLLVACIAVLFVHKVQALECQVTFTNTGAYSSSLFYVGQVQPAQSLYPRSTKNYDGTEM